MPFCKSKVFIVIFLIIVSIVFFLWQNNDILTTNIEYKNSKVPETFNGFSIVQVSDLHNKEFGKGQNRLIKKIKEASPDIIVITGDLIDRRRYNIHTSMVFIKAAIKIAPIYYVPGNHEAWSGKYDDIKKELMDAGVNVLDDEKLDLVKGPSKIQIIGVKDPSFLTSTYSQDTDYSDLEKTVKDLSKDSSFQILLSHRPEIFDFYAKENIDLSFTGHAHGGQFRIPFIGGLVVPDQGFFPKYTSGLYKKGGSSMVVNRGLGNSIVPIRIFNRPEIIKLVLNNK